MALINKTRNLVLSDELPFAETFGEKTRGLAGSLLPRALAFRTRWGIHTFGMRFPIDVLVCDDALRVKVIRRDMRHRSFFFWNPKYSRVFELPAGALKRSGTEIGDQLTIE